jgi:citrate synthase
MTDTVKINRGLKGIYFERSGVSDIDGRAGTLHYRGYSIDDLATQFVVRGGRLSAHPRRIAEPGATGRA